MYNTIEKCLKLKEIGFTYNKEAGIIYSHMNTPLKGRVIKLLPSKKYIIQEAIVLSKDIFAWYMVYDKLPITTLRHLDGNYDNNKIDNLQEMVRTKKKYIYSRTPKIKKIKKINENYIKDIELTYNIIISKAKGYLLKDAEQMLIKIATEVANKFYYKNQMDKEDAKQEALIQLFTNWKHFDETKYQKSFPYFTELSKRAIARSHTMIYDKKTVRNLIK